MSNLTFESKFVMSDGMRTSRCVKCGSPADPLYRRYGKHALRLTQCGTCGNIADKYIEYDPFIIIIDLVLLSKDAYRHVLYNTDFNAFWRLFIILMAMDTYIDWSDEYILENKLIKNSNSSDQYTATMSLQKFPDNMDEKVLFKFGGIFICNMFSTLFYIGTTFALSLYIGLNSSIRDKVDYLLIWKAFTLASIGKFLMLPVLIWGSEYDFSIHSILVFGYVFLALINVQSVIFRCSKSKSFLLFIVSYMIKIGISVNLRMIIF